MRNFILFIVVVSVLSIAGFVLYRVYVQGESADTVFQELGGREENPDVLAEAKEAYSQGDYAQAVKGFELALEAHESDVPGARLEEEKHRSLLLQTASCYKHLWENGGKTDDVLRLKALRGYEKYLEKYPTTSRQGLGRVMAELRTPSPAPAANVVDESPPK